MKEKTTTTNTKQDYKQTGKTKQVNKQKKIATKKFGNNTTHVTISPPI